MVTTEIERIKVGKLQDQSAKDDYPYHFHVGGASLAIGAASSNVGNVVGHAGAGDSVVAAASNVISGLVGAVGSTLDQNVM
ncbi:hypothetical protein EVAR_13804_1 [Eumeta japonica]|uniref:Uncharacterized protein n=1 Tax=Eumeta variegata TaxID=151549 RepID=A0A4C1U1D3_EUMVA|nr:hypothetical protein EVAR_13804_1 [Eumeta japonica]